MPETLKIQIEKYANGGYGLGFHRGMAVFVPYATPGDRVLARLTLRKKNHAFGEIEDILTPSPHRSQPECPNFTECGGCHFLHVSYDEELKAKSALLHETLVRLGKIDENHVPSIELLSDERYNYRTHATVQCDHTGMGFFKRESHVIKPFPGGGCRLLAAPLVHTLEGMNITENTELKIAMDHQGTCHYSTGKPVTLIEVEDGITYHRDLYSFFQANGRLRTTMLKLTAEMSHLSGTQSFVDIGCGVGFFTLYLAGKARKGLGIDVVEESIQWGQKNARLNHITNITFKRLHGDLLHPYREHFDVVLVDPPRLGLNTKTRNTISAMSPGKIVYVSCNPVTFARDCGDFINAGYSFQRLTLLDMFPGTHHTEVIGLFVK